MLDRKNPSVGFSDGESLFGTHSSEYRQNSLTARLQGNQLKRLTIAWYAIVCLTWFYLVDDTSDHFELRSQICVSDVNV